VFDIQGLNIYLIGMMGCGKSTIGPLLAAKLGYSFLDTDTTIEKLVDRSITELFEAVGEPEFRKLETQVLAEVSAHIRLVVATGGGIAIERENWNHLHQGLVIWLDPSIDLLVERLQHDTTRPILATSADLQTKLEHLLADRRHRYAEADIHLPILTKLAPEEIVDRILAAIPTVLKTPSITPD
jgi:shikimate kinase